MSKKSQNEQTKLGYDAVPTREELGLEPDFSQPEDDSLTSAQEIHSRQITYLSIVCSYLEEQLQQAENKLEELQQDFYTKYQP